MPPKRSKAWIRKYKAERLLAPFSAIGFDLKAPCNDCPFLNTSPYHEGVASSLPMYADSIEAFQFAHTFHKTDNRPECDGPRNYRGERPQHCYGAMLMLAKSGLDHQVPLIRAAAAGN